MSERSNGVSDLADDVEADAPPLTLRQRRRDALLQDALVFCTVFSVGALAYAIGTLVLDEAETFWSVSLSDGLILSGLVLAELFLLWNNGVRQGVRGHSIGKHRVGIQVVDTRTGRPVGSLRGFWRGLVVVGLLDLALAVIPVGLPTVLRRLTPEAWHVGAFAYVAVLVLVLPLLLPTDRGLADRLSGTTVVDSTDTTTPSHRSALLVVDALGVVGVLAVFVLYLSFLWPLIGQMPGLW